ncbi:MAG: hypothetical protein JST54_01000 [Deltaproteobacteria bacterium]|nr:hypothetical protein [Deltaproteobacteria bacterium]
MKRSGTMLVISREHLIDAIPESKPESIERLVAALESFGAVLLVLQGPGEVEPLSGAAPDIQVQACSNIREIVYSPLAMPSLTKEKNFQRAIYQSQLNADKILNRSSQRVGLRSKRETELYWRSVVTRVRGWMGRDAGQIVARWNSEAVKPLTESRVQSVEEAVSATGVLVQPMLDLAAARELDTTEVLREHARALEHPELYPGRTLAMKVLEWNQRNHGRGRLDTDWLDAQHAAYFPYVDIATCDANTFACVVRAAGAVEMPRRCSIAKGTDLRFIVETLKGFPDLVDPLV